MSIINIEKGKVQGTVGIEKSVEASAMSLLLDTVQKDMYQHPEASTIRELVSNSIDAQKEKEKAIEILIGKSKIEDYYFTREDSKYKDSNFDLSYYKLECLDIKNNNIKITYIVGESGVGWCDKLIIRDCGVGLGDRRLEGCLTKLGYSTKRNSTQFLGAYGFGGKVALSLNNDFYTTETVHNNRKFKFNSYSYKIDSLIGKFNDKGENKFIEFNNGSKIYYEKTESLNYTEVTVPCKTFHKEKFKHAVESQLLYFDNVDFSIIDKDGNIKNIDFKAKILYNSENLIVADQYTYSKPHVIVVKDLKSSVGVSYGYISFKEMEMQELFGSVGFKTPIRQVIVDEQTGKETVIVEGIDVTSSRESVKWTDNTRNYIKKQLEIATEEANTIVEQQLKEDDFLLWLDKAKNVMSNVGGSSSNPTLKHLSNIIDKTQLSPNYNLDRSIKYVQPSLLFWGFSVRKNFKTYDHKSKKDDMQRDEVKYWSDFNCHSCYFQLGATSVSKDFYLNHTIGSFTTIRILDDESLEKFIKEDEFDENGNIKPNKWTKEYIDKLKAKRDSIIGYLKKSKLFKSYDDVLVPEDWNKKFEETNKVSETGETVEKLTPLELRKLAEQTIVHSLRKDDYRKDNLPFSWNKQEIKIGDLKDSNDKIYYSYGDEDTIPFTTILLYKMFNGVFDSSTIRLYRVSKSMPKKFLKKHKHIDSFYQIKNNKQVTMSGELIHWITAKLIHDKMDELKFMRNYDLFNLDIANLYKEVKEYKEANFHESYVEQLAKYGDKGKTFIEGVLAYTSKVAELQLFIREHKDSNPEEIKRKSLELFGIDTIESSIGYNLEMYDKLQTLLNYAESIKPLFNHVTVLTDIKKLEITVETECLIKEVIESKGLNQFIIPEFKKDVIEEVIAEETKEEDSVILID